MSASSSSPAPVSDHWNGRQFFNPGSVASRTLRDLLRWKTAGDRRPWPRRLGDHSPRPLPPVAAGRGVAVTFVNQSTFLLRTGGVAILTDPIWSERASPVSWAGPRRNRPPGIAFSALPAIQFVLLSHNHYDHMDLPTLRRLEYRFRPRIITPLGNGRYLRRHGLSRVCELNWWQAVEPRAGLRVTLTPAHHFSARGLFDRNTALWGGFFISLAGQRIYFAGDTGYGAHFRQIQERLGRPDLALLPIGAYEPRWFMRAAHINPEDAVQAHRDLGCGRSFGMHFGTFQLTDEGIDEPLTALAAARAGAHLGADEFAVLDFGETRVMG